MSNPTLSWLPEGESTTQTATFPRQVSMYHGGRDVDAKTTVSLGGKAVSVVHDVHDSFQIELKGFGPANDATFFAQLWSWWAHASRGGEFAFAIDGADTLNTTTSSGNTQGDTTVSVATTSTLAVGDWVTLEDVTDPTKTERRKVSAISGASVGLTPTISYSFGSGSTMRHAEYLPACVVIEKKQPFRERDAGRGGRLWDMRLRIRTVR